MCYWSAQTIARVFTFDYINFYKTFEENSPVFTMKGWNSFKKVLVEKDLVRPVVNQREVLTIALRCAPIWLYGCKQRSICLANAGSTTVAV